MLALAGLGYGAITAAVLSLVSDLLPSRRGLGMGMLSATYGLGSVSGPIVAAAIIQRFGWRGATATVGCIAATIALIQWLRVREPIRPQAAPRRREHRKAADDEPEHDASGRGAVLRRLGVLDHLFLDPDVSARGREN